MSKTRKVKRATAHKPKANPSRASKNGKARKEPAHAASHGSPAPEPPARPAAPAAAAPKGIAGRLAAMMAASKDNDSVAVKSGASSGTEPPAFEVKHAGSSHSPAPAPSARPGPPPPAPAPVASTKGKQIVVDDEDDEDDAPMVVKGGAATKAQSLGDGVQVASKGPAKFSMEDLEALRKAIVIKGSGRIVAGINLDELKYDQEGLVAVVAQDRATGAVLMAAHANKEALEKSLTTNEMTYFSRSRNKLWTKGEDSGNTQRLVTLKVDCDKDAVLAVVEQKGVACHRETGTCFNDDRTLPVAGFLGELDAVIAQRNKDRPEDSYTTTLLEDPSLAAGKVVEEAKEVATVLKGKPNKDTLQHEAADLLFHLLVACRGKGVGLREIVAELLERHKKEESAPKKDKK